MEKILDIAQYIYDSYKAEAQENIDELKLQKLLYFAQRESLAILGEPLFSENLEGWVHGPVSPHVRSYFSSDNGINYDTKDISIEAKRMVNNVICEYGHLASWKLRNLSHEEISWKNSRIGLSERARGNRTIDISDIEKDAEKVRPFDHTWGMYYDEFDDYEGEVN